MGIVHPLDTARDRIPIGMQSFLKNSGVRYGTDSARATRAPVIKCGSARVNLRMAIEQVRARGRQ